MQSQFTDEVFPAELEEITKRRRQCKLKCPEPNGPPSVRMGLIGLALSGGGIRSATFSLGVIQALIQKRKLRFIDYLSTVSGGGYIGSCLSSVLNRPDDAESVFENVEGTEETATIKQLRNSSNFLAPGGVVDKMRLPMILLRGLLLNVWLIIPALILAVFLTELIMELWHRAGAPIVSPLIIVAPFIVLAILYPSVMRVWGGSFNWRMRNLYEKALAILFTLSVLTLVTVPVLWLVGFCIDNNWDGHISDFFHFPSIKGQLLQIGLVIGGLILVFSLTKAFQLFPAVVRMVINTMVAIAGPLIVLGIYLLFCIFFVESPYFSDRIDENSSNQQFHSYSDILDSLAEKGPNQDDSTASKILMEALRENHIAGPETSINDPNISVEKPPLDSGKPSWVLTIGGQERVKQERVKQGRVKIDSVGRYLFVPEKSLFNLHAAWIFYAGGLIIFVLNVFFFDANVTSTHSFYRDRLSAAYLFRVTNDGGIKSNDDQKLSGLNADGTVAPYHLINTTLNLPGSDDPNLRGRNADFFILAKHYCGSEHTGYCKTGDIEVADRHLNLGSAMAISAAAAAPNMGSFTKSSFVFMMALLNLRLGYWIPNPSKIIPAGRLKRFLWPNVGPRYLLKEALGRLDAGGSHVNLSDGGHIENLGIYQLLKRRCKLIIATDAEADPTASFAGLITLIRFARIDMGIRIKIDIGELRKNELDLSGRHWAIGTIRYETNGDSNPETGHLLYIKASLTGDENQYISAYKQSDSTFPHQTTADQFFDETQFEVYRSLGEHIANQALSDQDVGKIMSSAI